MNLGVMATVVAQDETRRLCSGSNMQAITNNGHNHVQHRDGVADVLKFDLEDWGGISLKNSKPPVDVTGARSNCEKIVLVPNVEAHPP